MANQDVSLFRRQSPHGLHGRPSFRARLSGYTAVMKTRLLIACAVALAIAAAFLLRPGAPTLEGIWSGKDWGQVVFVDGKGTYTDTYGSSPGVIQLQEIGPRAYEGTWGESLERHGKLTLTLSDDGQSANGSWTADEDCEIKGNPGGALQWLRSK